MKGAVKHRCAPTRRAELKTRNTQSRSRFGKVQTFLMKLSLCLSREPASPLLGPDLRETEAPVPQRPPGTIHGGTVRQSPKEGVTLPATSS